MEQYGQHHEDERIDDEGRAQQSIQLVPDDRIDVPVDPLGFLAATVVLTEPVGRPLSGFSTVTVPSMWEVMTHLTP